MRNDEKLFRLFIVLIVVMILVVIVYNVIYENVTLITSNNTINKVADDGACINGFLFIYSDGGLFSSDSNTQVIGNDNKPVTCIDITQNRWRHAK